MDELSYEHAQQRLEEIVNELQKGGKTLDESVKLFEEGAKLSDFCNKALKNAEMKIMSLSADADGEKE